VTFDLGWPWTILHLGHRSFIIKCLEYGERHNVGHNGVEKGNLLWTCDWHYDYEHWPWMTLNCPSLRSLKLHIRYFENGDRYSDGVNESRIGNHAWAIDWHCYLWPWMTLNNLRSRSQDFSIKYMATCCLALWYTVCNENSNEQILVPQNVFVVVSKIYRISLSYALVSFRDVLQCEYFCGFVCEAVLRTSLQHFTTLWYVSSHLPPAVPVSCASVLFFWHIVTAV